MNNTHSGEKTSDELNTSEIKKIAEVEASIEKRLANAKLEAEKMVTAAREYAEDELESAKEEAAVLKIREVERVRQGEIEKSKLLVKEAEKTSREIAALDTGKASKKMFEEFLLLIKR